MALCFARAANKKKKREHSPLRKQPKYGRKRANWCASSKFRTTLCLRIYEYETAGNGSRRESDHNLWIVKTTEYVVLFPKYHKYHVFARYHITLCIIHECSIVAANLFYSVLIGGRWKMTTRRQPNWVHTSRTSAKCVELLSLRITAPTIYCTATVHRVIAMQIAHFFLYIEMACVRRPPHQELIMWKWPELTTQHKMTCYTAKWIRRAAHTEWLWLSVKWLLTPLSPSSLFSL